MHHPCRIRHHLWLGRYPVTFDSLRYISHVSQFYHGGTRSQYEHNCINVSERILFVHDFKLIDKFTDGLLFKSYINIRNGHVTIICI